LRAFFAKNSSLRERHGYAKSEAMPTEPPSQSPSAPDSAEAQRTEQRPLSPAAERALAEAAARRAERDRKAAEQPRESSGRGGLDPTRYGDWEKDGLISDF
jgi:hypothetical protein